MRSRHSSRNIAHIEDGDLHAAAAALHVLVTPSSEGGYYAQGIEIDYAAIGSTELDACRNFERGFIHTVQAYIKRGLDLGRLYAHSQTPAEYLEAFKIAKTQHQFHCYVAVDLGQAAPAAIPRNLAFIHGGHAVAA